MLILTTAPLEPRASPVTALGPVGAIPARAHDDAPMIDRLLHHSVMVTQGESFRMREARSRGR
jgi:hypothetical protein